MRIIIHRIYDGPAPTKYLRVLVDRLWPRGVRQDAAGVDLWLKGIAPSTPLRKWFGHDRKKWNEFRDRYFQELDSRAFFVQEIVSRAGRRDVVLLYGAKDDKHNNAVALREYLTRHGLGRASQAA